MKQVAARGGGKWIVSLLESDHNVMINEGLIATSLLIALNSGNINVICWTTQYPHAVLEETTKLLLEYDLLQKAIKLLQDEKATPEVLFNSISLLEALQKTGNSMDTQSFLW